MDNNIVGVPTVGRTAILRTTIIRGNRPIQAILFQSLFTVFAGSAGVYQTTYTSELTSFEFLYSRSGFDYTAYDLMAWYHRKDPGKPIVPDLVQI